MSVRARSAPGGSIAIASLKSALRIDRMMFNHVLTTQFQWLAVNGKRSTVDREANARIGHRLALSAGAAASVFAVDPTPSNLAVRAWRGGGGKMATS